MASDELISYIKDELKNGRSQEAIRQKLRIVGWQDQQIDEAFTQALTGTIETSGEPKRSVFPSSVAVQSSGSPQKRKLSYFFDILSGQRRFRAVVAALLLAALSGILVSYPFITKALLVLDNLEQKAEMVIEEVFPENLEIKIEQGRLSTNVTEPYFLTISSQTLEDVLSLKKDIAERSQAKIRLLTINTKGKAEDFERYQSLAMLTSTSLVYYGDDAVEIHSLSTVPDVTITRQYLLDQLHELNGRYQIAQILKIFLYLAPVFIILVFFLYYLVAVLSNAFFLWIINKIHKTSINFTKLFALAGALYLIPAILLTVIRLVPAINIFYLWFYTALDVVVLAFGYTLITEYREQLTEKLL